MSESPAFDQRADLAAEALSNTAITLATLVHDDHQEVGAVALLLMAAAVAAEEGNCIGNLIDLTEELLRTFQEAA